MATYVLNDEMQVIGKAGERGITIAIDIAAWKQAQPDGVGGILATRPAGDRLPLVTQIVGDKMLADLPQECTDRPGRYDYTATWTLAGELSQSHVYQTIILASEVGRGMPPECGRHKTPDWATEIYIKAEQVVNALDAALQLEGYAAEAVEAADDAKGYADSAAESMESAAADALRAETAADSVTAATVAETIQYLGI